MVLFELWLIFTLHVKNYVLMSCKMFHRSCSSAVERLEQRLMPVNELSNRRIIFSNRFSLIHEYLIGHFHWTRKWTGNRIKLYGAVFVLISIAHDGAITVRNVRVGRRRKKSSTVWLEPRIQLRLNIKFSFNFSHSIFTVAAKCKAEHCRPFVFFKHIQ